MKIGSRTSTPTVLALAAIGVTFSALHCSSSSDSASSCAATADPTNLAHVSTTQQAVITRAADRAKAALSPAEWRYLFKLRYAFFPRATVETDPVVVKALAAMAQEAPSCGAGAAPASACDRFANVGRCWISSPMNATIVSCYAWPMVVASSAGCTVPTAPAAAPVDAEAWDDSQDGRETTDCEAPCTAGGSCLKASCKCTPDEAACAGGCARTKSDVNNCGGCGVACGPGVACVAGVCGGTAPADAGADAAPDGG